MANKSTKLQVPEAEPGGNEALEYAILQAGSMAMLAGTIGVAEGSVRFWRKRASVASGPAARLIELLYLKRTDWTFQDLMRAPEA